VNPDRNRRVLPVLMTEVEELAEGDVYQHIMSGGGGYGEPLEREPGDVLADVVDEKVTPDHARDEYGVVVSGSGRSARLDLKATDLLRISMRNATA
jgi:N-methylhydantoinase B